MTFKTIRGTGGGGIKLGQPQIQTVINDDSYAFALNMKQDSPGSFASQISTGAQFIQIGKNELNSNSNHSLTQLTQLLISDNDTLLPAFHTHSPNNQILPTFALHLRPRNVSGINHGLSERFVNSAKVFQPYELITGISHERPEIIMLTDFLPIIVNDGNQSHPAAIIHVANGGYDAYLTPAGHLLNTHIQTRNLRYQNGLQMMTRLRQQFKHLHLHFKNNHEALEKSLHDLSTDTDFLLELIRQKEVAKRQLDVRHSIHTTDSEKIVKKNSIAKHGENTQKLDTSIDLTSRLLPPSYSTSDILVRLGYDQNHIKNYSSTKIWLQTLEELKDILRYHSLEFLDIAPSRQKRDENGGTITKNATKEFFTFNEELTSLIRLKEFYNLASWQITKVVGEIEASWKILYRNVHFSSQEVRIAGMINLLSKEYRYSLGLTDPVTQRILSEYFSYEIRTDGNLGLFDNVIGLIGNQTFDIPAKQTNSLANLAHVQPAENVEVATFETNYVNTRNGNLTPGGVFYIDSVLNSSDGQTFDTTRLYDLTNLLIKTVTQFRTLVNGMNLTGDFHSIKSDFANRKHANIVENPQDLVRGLIGSLIDLNTGNTQVAIKRDALNSLFTLANKNSKVKALLFTLMMLRISRSYHSSTNKSVNSNALTSDNTPTTDVLINELLIELEASVKHAKALTRHQKSIKLSVHKGDETTELTGTAIKALLKANAPTTLMATVDTFMKNISSAFNEINTDDGFTRYSKVSDTSIMMVLFDILVQMISKFSSQTFVSVSNDKHSEPTFTIVTSETNNKELANFLIGRIDKEISLTLQIVYSIYNSLDMLGRSTRNFYNFLNSPNSKQTLKKISETLQNNDLLKMLISEQQIYMLAATVQDFIENIKKSNASSKTDDVDGDGDVDDNDALTIFDDSVISSKVKNALFGFFGSEQYSSKQGNNKKILTVGIPLGFSHKLQQLASKQNAPANKQSDIVQVVVYKIDIQNSDLSYKPQRFLFELSRFPTRNDDFYLPIPENPSLDEILHAIPTRDFGSSIEPTHSPEYFPIKLGGVPIGTKIAMSTSDYSFLSKEEKSEIVRNHVTSYLLEVYTKLLTGISLGDYDFDMIDHPREMSDEFVKLIAEHHVSDMVEKMNVKTSSIKDNSPTGGVLFSRTSSVNTKKLMESSSKNNPLAKTKHRANVSGVAGSVDLNVQFGSIQSTNNNSIASQNVGGNIGPDLSSVSHRNAPVVLHGIRTISNVSRMKSTLSDPQTIVKRLLTPKQFDRVFNIIIDPDNFEIDYDQTMKTVAGVAAFHQLFRKGDIIAATENDVALQTLKSRNSNSSIQKNYRPFVQNRQDRESHKFYYRNRDKNEGDITLEKYFITIETLEEGNKK